MSWVDRHIGSLTVFALYFFSGAGLLIHAHATGLAANPWYVSAWLFTQVLVVWPGIPLALIYWIEAARK